MESGDEKSTTKAKAMHEASAGCSANTTTLQPEAQRKEPGLIPGTTPRTPADDQTNRSRPPWMREETISGKPFPFEPDVFKFVQMPKTTTNHTYRIFSTIPFDPSYRMPKVVGEMNFHEKLYCLLILDEDSRRNTVDWCYGGRAFCIRDPEQLVKLQLLQYYFGTNSIHRFRRQMNGFGYKRLTREETTYGFDCYYSEVRCEMHTG